ncbi:MAG: YlbF family regulator [Erysipelotrichales bacterium]|nr:YlbF family regulator [Erysipelotrichales bacterium]
MIEKNLIDDLVNEIEDLEIVRRFNYLETEINGSELVKRNRKRLASLQKKRVQKIITETENNEYQELLKFFNEHPILKEFQEIQAEINDLILSINQIINQELN